MIKNRCAWASSDPLYIAYHDNEWGVPLFDEQKLFEFLILEGMQAGLSWITVLKKRDNFRQAFDQFDPEKIARYDTKKIESLMSNAGIIRNRLKIHAAIKNAHAFLKIKEEQKNFSDYIWQFVNSSPIRNAWKSLEDVPSETDYSKKMSQQLKKDGFKFVGPTLCYAFMQATGMVSDHTKNCFLYEVQA